MIEMHVFCTVMSSSSLEQPLNKMSWISELCLTDASVGYTKRFSLLKHAMLLASNLPRHCSSRFFDAESHSCSLKRLSKWQNVFLRYFDPVNISFANMNKYFLRWPVWCFGYNGNTDPCSLNPFLADASFGQPKNCSHVVVRKIMPKYPYTVLFDLEAVITVLDVWFWQPYYWESSSMSSKCISYWNLNHWAWHVKLESRWCGIG